jgi:hypothetical protein
MATKEDILEQLVEEFLIAPVSLQYPYGVDLSLGSIRVW